MKFTRKYEREARVRILALAFLLYTLGISPLLFGQDNYPIGSRAAALANAVVADSDLWSVYHNQAGLGDFHQLGIGFHHENKYVVEEFSLHAIALTVPVKPGTIGLSYSYFGYPDYNESKFGLGFGKNFGEKISAGIQLNYHYIYILGEYENRHALSVEGGIQYKPLEGLRIGIHVFNPTRSVFAPTNLDTLNTTVRAGISYSPGSKLWLSVETEKSINFDFRLKSGIEYELLHGLSLRTGIITNPFQNSFGLGFKIKKISADVAFTHTDLLGFVPHFSAQINLK